MLSDNYVVIQGWMCNELELKGNELLVYALIYGFSQDNKSLFMGSRTYIADTFNISLPTVDKALNSLKDKHLIECYTDAKTYWHYKTTGKETLPGGVKNLYGVGKESLPNKQVNKQTNKKVILSKDNITTGFEFGNRNKPVKENLYQRCKSLIYSKTEDPEIRRLLIDWLNMLLEKYKSKDKVLYVNVFKGKLNMLDKYEEKDWKDIIEFNLQKGYEGFYPITQRKSTIQQIDPAISHPITEEEKRQLEIEVKERERRGLRTKF